ncbi:SET domain-containing protein-lysine N-methyltransferase [Candidatus Dependentiae bacterium]|nr:SET domain-containing protein-lysine N-methyltransferase [Candidatus Dependentiae bacterium]
MKKIFYRLFAVQILLSFELVTKEYTYFSKKHKKFTAKKQKEELFENVGCRYSNSMVIDVEVDMVPAQNSEYFQNNQDRIVSLSSQYKKDVINKTLAPMYLKFVSPVIGYGIFAAAPIKKDDFIGVYTGRLRNLHWDKPDFHEDVDYAWYYTISDKKNNYMIIDGKYEGNDLRFINHADNPNTKRIDIIVENLFYVCYIACRDIAINEELTVSYGNGYWTSRGITPEISTNASN